jgi:hypothetical protein
VLAPPQQPVNEGGQLPGGREHRDISSFAPCQFAIVRWGQPYVDEGAEAYERRYQQFRITALKARELGYELPAR